MSIYLYINKDDYAKSKLMNLSYRIKDLKFYYIETNIIVLELSLALSRKIKLIQLTGKGGKKYLKLIHYLSKSKQFQSMKEVREYCVNRRLENFDSKWYSDESYSKMPKEPIKDNQKVYTLPNKKTNWDKISNKNKLIKAASKISGVKIRKPKKTASKKKWKNFLNKFGDLWQYRGNNVKKK